MRLRRKCFRDNNKIYFYLIRNTCKVYITLQKRVTDYKKKQILRNPKIWLIDLMANKFMYVIQNKI